MPVKPQIADWKLDDDLLSEFIKDFKKKLDVNDESWNIYSAELQSNVTYIDLAKWLNQRLIPRYVAIAIKTLCLSLPMKLKNLDDELMSHMARITRNREEAYNYIESINNYCQEIEETNSEQKNRIEKLEADVKVLEAEKKTMQLEASNVALKEAIKLMNGKQTKEEPEQPEKKMMKNNFGFGAKKKGDETE